MTNKDIQNSLISIVIPMLNEREGIDALFAEIAGAIDATPLTYEIIVVDDGSTDGTRDIIEEKLKRFKKWKFVLLSRNFGQQPAYRAGLEAATGDAVIFMEADLQDPPSLIPELISEWQKGYRVVTAVRTSREETGLRRLAFDLYHIIFYRLTDKIMPANSGMYSLIDRKVVDHILEAPETNLFLPALKNWFGYSQTSVKYSRLSRATGKPKQTLRKLINYGINGLTSFSDLPLQWIGVVGLIISVSSFAYAAILVLIKLARFCGYFESLEVKGFTTLAVAIFCLGGIQIVCIGILGQYLARIYREIKRRPLYIVESKTTSNEL